MHVEDSLASLLACGQLESSQNETLSRRIECLQAEREDLLRQRETLRESASRELKAVQQQLEVLHTGTTTTRGTTQWHNNN